MRVILTGTVINALASETDPVTGGLCWGTITGKEGEGTAGQKPSKAQQCENADHVVKCVALLGNYIMARKDKDSPSNTKTLKGAKL